MAGISYQLYSSRNFGPLGETLSMLGRLGYDEVEGYGGLFEGDVGALGGALDAAGLRMPSAHIGLAQIRAQTGAVIEAARRLGIETVFVPAIPPEERDKDAAGWAAFGRELAEAGKPLREAGLTFGWHNHDFEFATLDAAETPLDLILAGSDDLCLELDLAWVRRAGEDPAAWAEGYADRLVGAHLKDLAAPGTADEEDGWADLGHGTMDWPALIEVLRRTRCRHFVLEHDNPTDDARFAERSLATARELGLGA